MPVPSVETVYIFQSILNWSYFLIQVNCTALRGYWEISPNAINQKPVNINLARINLKNVFIGCSTVSINKKITGNRVDVFVMAESIQEKVTLYTGSCYKWLVSRVFKNSEIHKNPIWGLRGNDYMFAVKLMVPDQTMIQE